MATKTEPILESSGRRSFLGVLLGFAGTATGVLLAIPLLRFALHPLLAATTQTAWSELGAADEFAELNAPAKRIVKIEQLDGWRRIISEKSVYVIKGKEGQLRVLSAVCPHLGCAITWSDAKTQFLCPCHVGIFAADGALLSGPPHARWTSWKAGLKTDDCKCGINTFVSLSTPKKSSLEQH